MTLKDFHGGSIPFDLPLPSAPGVIVRPIDRTGSDRPTFWGNPVGRPNDRARPNSSPATRRSDRATSWGNPVGQPDNHDRPNSSPTTRHFDDKTQFFSSSVHIGRYFEEDERKSLDGGSAPRRTITDECFGVQASHVEKKPESVYAGRILGQYLSAPVVLMSSGSGNLYSSRVYGVTIGRLLLGCILTHGQLGR
ncbi:uncharacterized protein LOC120163637 [Hibiscus syriacus]|uniref:uncharacterized protein LOC120163637 n=1 Tax=Hibiscus syriacus TaxID=106335 RepID=UPI001922D853|nr:uncharacterized protein LOC120163637 [Hibiscus syriacus]